MFTKCRIFVISRESHIFLSIRKLSKKNPIISCKRPEFNYYGQPYGKHEDIPLASKGWEHRKSKGDYFIVKPDNKMESDVKLVGPGFETCRISNEVVQALSERNIVSPTKLQSKAIADILSGKNTMIAAETGCGKTLAYLLPLLEQIKEWKNYETEQPLNSPYALIITPSRELVLQIYEVAEHISNSLSLQTKYVIGGHIKRITRNPNPEYCDLLVASIGALSKLVSVGYYNISRVHHVVLDEADTLLDDSFSELVFNLMKKFPFQHQRSLMPLNGCQLTMASATMPKELPEELSEFVDIESIKNITSANLHRLLPHLPQRFLRMGKSQKALELLKIVKADVAKGIQVIIFSNKSATCDWISLFLNENGVKCLHFNGAMPLAIKNEHFKAFNNGDIQVLSCTDIGSRGLNTITTQHVINYDFPNFIVDYIHRCGRTGRLGSAKNCCVTNFVASGDDIKLVQRIEKSIRRNVDLPSVDNNVKRIILNRMEHVVHTNHQKDKSNAERMESSI